MQPAPPPLWRAGLAAARIDAPPDDSGQFDSEALWQVVATQLQMGQRVLIVRGDDEGAGHGAANGDSGDAGSAGAGRGRDWLATTLAAAGIRVEFVVAYQRQAPDWLAPQQALGAAAAQDGAVWLFSSSQAVANLRQLLPAQRWQQARAVATPFMARLRQAVGLRSLAAQSTSGPAKAIKTPSAAFKQYRESDGQFYFKLLDAKGALLLQSTGFANPKEAAQVMAQLKSGGASALPACQAFIASVADAAALDEALESLRAQAA
jgi:uncharacterized protein YegP (UPF0339 family)